MRVQNKIYAILLTCVVIICFGVIIGNKSVSSASTEPHKQLNYISVEIQPGDSLWSIAEQYYTDDWADIPTYMEQIKEFNDLTNDRIHAGNYLSVPYFNPAE